MSTEVRYTEFAGQAIEILTKGAFLTVAHGGKTNTMTIGWGNIGFAWGKPLFTVMVRPSRYTFPLLEASGEFTVSIPLQDMQKALTLCGTKSGRDLDKIAAAGLTLLPGQKIAAPAIAGCGLHYECKVVYKQPMVPDALAPELQQKCYGKGDYHAFYFGEIVACYKE